MKRRGISEVTGSVIMLGIVGTIAALVLTFGLTSIYDFNTFLIDVDVSESALKERLIINNVDFTADGTTVTIHVRNVGLNQLQIESISIINIATQDVILLYNDPNNTQTFIVLPKTKFSTPALENTGGCTFSDTAPLSGCAAANYVITIVTSRGNIFENEVRPFRL